jgi:multidrug efflux pump subunit AcrA (membrane-fusion protein)
MKKTIILFSLFVAISVFVIACSRISPPSDDSRVDDVESTTEISGDSTTAAPQPVQPPRTGTTVLADGQLVALKPVLPLSFAVGGRLTGILAQAGDVVAEGDVLATLDETALSEAVTGAELQVAQAETSLAQARLALEDLLNWEADEMVVASAEANLAVAQANHESALEQDSAAGSGLTPARVSMDQAQRALADAQEAYDKAWEPARDWELGDPWRKQALEYERDATARAVQNAEEGLQVAWANYNLTSAGLNDNNALGAEASLASARQALVQAQTGPKESEIAAARLQVVQAQLSIDQAQFNLDQANRALDDAVLYAPWGGTIFSVDTAAGAMVGAGTPILMLQDAGDLQFHTTNLSERDLVDVEPGQVVRVSLKSHPGDEIEGRVVRIVTQASGAIGDAATFIVVVELEPSELLLLPGMTGRAEILREAD